VNLLQPQERRSRNPGDTKEAAAARRRLLESDCGRALVAEVVAAMPMEAGQTLLDVGCGEGTHADSFRIAYEAETWGTDISTPAIELAARRFPECHWVIANADRSLPWADGSFDVLTSITARLNPPEFHRLLRGGGRLLVVIPAPDDLIELREAVQGEGLERDRVARTTAMFSPLFAPASHVTIRRKALLDRRAIADILSTSYRGFRPRERERANTLNAAEVTMSRDVLTFERV
jgi:23S rRNA (guanine745-N1)-methyltransferase